MFVSLFFEHPMKLSGSKYCDTGFILSDKLWILRSHDYTSNEFWWTGVPRGTLNLILVFKCIGFVIGKVYILKEDTKMKKHEKKTRSLEREYVGTSINMAKTSCTTTKYWERHDVNIVKHILVENYYVYSLV